MTTLASYPNVVVVYPALPVNSLRELIALAKAKPGALNYAGMAWLAPVRTPPAVIKKLNSEMGEWLNMRVVHERFTAEGAEPGGTSPEAFAAIIKSEVTKWATVIRAAGIRPE